MYEYDHQDLFYADGTNKQYLILLEADDGEDPITLTNEDLEDESFEIFDAIMDSETLTFSNCFSCYIKFITYSDEPMMGKLISVFEILEYDTENPIPIGAFVVQSDNLATDGQTREIYAYDFMYDIINSDVIDWYNSLEFPITIKDMRDSLFEEFGMEQDNEALINDDIEVPKQLSDADIIGGNAIIKAICDINGVFCHIGKDGLVHWITLDTGNIYETPLYPGFYPSENTYPGGDHYEGNVQDIYKNYYQENSVIWANYETEMCDGVQLRNEWNEIAYQTDEGALNPYIVINNFLCYGLSYGQYEQIANRLFNKIKKLTYVPFQMSKMGDPCMEVGDRVVVYTQEGIKFVSYIFSKHGVGILQQFEDITTKGTLYMGQYDTGGVKQAVDKKIKNLDQRVGNMEKSGSGMIQIRSVEQLPETVELNVLYLIQGTVVVE